MVRDTLKWGIRGPLLLLLGILVADAAQAQLRRRDPDKWELSVSGGVGWLGGQQEFPTLLDTGASNLVRLESGSGWALGLRISENLSSFFAAEFEYAFQNQPLTALNLAPSVPRLKLDQRVHNWTYNALIYPLSRKGRIRPFGTVGAGASLFQLASDATADGVASGLDLVDRWKFAWSWGGGVKLRMDGPWGVRFDFRDHISPVPDYGIPRTGQTFNGVTNPAFRADGLFHNYQLTVGFIYFFQP